MKWNERSTRVIIIIIKWNCNKKYKVRHVDTLLCCSLLTKALCKFSCCSVFFSFDFVLLRDGPFCFLSRFITRQILTAVSPLSIFFLYYCFKFLVLLVSKRYVFIVLSLLLIFLLLVFIVTSISFNSYDSYTCIQFFFLTCNN